MKFVTRSQWGASPQKATAKTHPIGKTYGVTLHWEGPHMGKFPHSACASKVRGIETFHEKTRKWADLAYSALVCPHGYVFEGRGVGVQSAANGNNDTNDDWYAVCYLGGVDDPFTDEGKQGFIDAVQWLRKNGAGPKVNGHRDHKATQCPGDAIYRWLHSTDFNKPNQEDEVNADQEKLLKETLATAQRAEAWSKSARAQAHAAHIKTIENRKILDAIMAKEGIKIDAASIEQMSQMIADGIADDVADELSRRLTD